MDSFKEFMQKEGFFDKTKGGYARCIAGTSYDEYSLHS
jgi:hypothetical protein